MYLFIAIIFIAELIIAITIINYIVKADKLVCRYNSYVEVFNPLCETCLQYIRCVVTNINQSFEKVFVFIRKKREQVFYKFIIMAALYLFLILFKIKTTNFSNIYKLIGAIRDVVADFII